MPESGPAEAGSSGDVFERAFFLAGDAMAISTLDDGCLVHVNPALCHMLERGEGDLIGKTDAELEIWVSPTERAQLAGELLDKGKTGPTKVQFRTSSGEIREASFASVLMDGDQQLVLSIFRDITEEVEADRALRLSEDRYRLIAETASDFAYSLLITGDSTFEREWITPAFTRILGYEPDEVDSSEWMNYVHPDDLAPSAEALGRAIAGEEVTSEVRLIAKNGEYKWLRFRSKAETDEEAGQVRVVGAGSDITEEKHQSDALKEAELRYRTLVEHVPAINYVWTSAQDVGKDSAPYISPQVEPILGYSAEEWQAKPDMWMRGVHPDDKDRVLKAWRLAEEHAEPFRTEYRMATKDGREIWLRDEAHLVALNEKGVAQWQGVMFDITDRKQTEEALQESERRFRTLVEQIPAVTFMEEYLDPNGPLETNPLLYISPQFESVWGRSTDERMADPAMWRETLHPDDLQRVIAEDEHASRTGESLVSDYRMVHPDGQVSWIHEDTRLVRSPEGTPLYWLGVMFDVTQAKEAEQELRATSERLSALYEIDKAILAAQSLQEIASSATRRVRELVGCDRASLVEFDHESEMVIGLAVDSREPTELSPERIRFAFADFGETVEGLRAGRAEIRDEIRDDMSPLASALREEGLRSALLVPLIADTELIGSLALLSTEPAFFTEEHEHVAREVADSIAIALHQARLHEKVEAYAAELETSLEDLRKSDAQRRALLGRLVRAQEEERQRIASDIHDDSIQKMAAINLRLETLRRRITGDDAMATLDGIEAAVQESIRRLRHLMFELWPPGLDRQGLAAAVRTELDQTKSEAGLTYELEEAIREEPSVEIRTIAYRIIQEAITNVRKHAAARKVRVSLTSKNGGISVRIADDGDGFEGAGESPPGHFGLSGIKERASLAGGWLTVDSEPGRGTTVEFWLPAEE